MRFLHCDTTGGYSLSSQLNLFATDYDKSGQNAKMMNVLLYGLDGTTLRSIDINSLGQLTVVGPADSYTVTNDGTNYTKFTRASDGKAINLTWVGGFITAISDWT